MDIFFLAPRVEVGKLSQSFPNVFPSGDLRQIRPVNLRLKGGFNDEPDHESTAIYLRTNHGVFYQEYLRLKFRVRRSAPHTFGNFPPLLLEKNPNITGGRRDD